jgi:hypothetical protein
MAVVAETNTRVGETGCGGGLVVGWCGSESIFGVPPWWSSSVFLSI